MNNTDDQNPYDSPADEQNNEGSAGADVPTWFWVVSGLAVLWNLMGLMVFVVERMMVANPEAMGAMTEAQQELYQQIPTWVVVAFAVAVIAGTLGSIGLLMRKKWSTPVLLVSLLGVLGQQAYMFFLSNTFEVMGWGIANVAMPLMVLVIAIALFFFSISSVNKGWLR